MELRYDETYAVEMFDWVEVTCPITGIVYDGQVKKIKPRAARVVCLIEDHNDWTRGGNLRRKRMEVAVEHVVLIRRDG